MKLKAFFIIFEGQISLKQIKKFFLEGESPTLSIFPWTQCKLNLKMKKRFQF